MRRIGVIVDLIGQYGRTVLSGINRFALANGQIHYAVRPRWLELEPLENCEHWDVDGMIVQLAFLKFVDKLRQLNIPTVNVSTIVADTGLPTVAVDCAAIGRMAAEHLLERGLRNFAFFGTETHFSALRGAAFAQRIAEAGWPCHCPHISVNEARRGATNRQEFLGVLRTLPQPLGVFAPNDDGAAQIIEACTDIGIAIPEQFAVLGCDADDLINSCSRPSLSSISVPADQVGFEAARMLLDLMDGKPVAASKMLPPNGVITRKSTDILAIDDREVAEALRYIRQNAHKQIRVEEVVRQVPLSRRVLEQRFRKVVGRSPLAEIQRVQLELARQLLVETDLQMPEIAERSGFARASYFGEVFRKKFAMTPTDYRRRHRQRGSAAGADNL